MEEREEVNEFKYLGSVASPDDGMETKLKNMLGEGVKVWEGWLACE